MLIQNSEKISQMPCSICWDSKRWYQEIRELKCGHRFHFECIHNWSQLNQSCPLCRTPILKQNRFNTVLYMYARKRGNTVLMNNVELNSGIEYN